MLRTMIRSPRTAVATVLSAILALQCAPDALAAPTPGSAGMVATVTSGQALVYALQEAGFNRLSAVLQDNMDVSDAILLNAGPKLFLAPTDAAMDRLPPWVTGSRRILQATLLQHVLNGSFPLDEVPRAPLHAVGHSLLADSRFANLPGGNGMPVALGKGADGNHFVAEALGASPFNGSVSHFYDITIAPLAAAITTPGNTSFTLGFIGNNSHLIASLGEHAAESAAQLDNVRGVTIFAPTDAAFRRRAAQTTGMSDQDMAAVVGQHIVAGRAVYSPLLETQGSLVTTSGQDMVFDAEQMTVRVGNSTAKIVQSDIITANGVIHRIDDVLLDTNSDPARAQQAFQSAQAWQMGPINGFIKGDNAGSSQGMNVPAAQDGSSRNTNATVQANGGVQRGASMTGAANSTVSGDASNSTAPGSKVSTSAGQRVALLTGTVAAAVGSAASLLLLL